MIHPFHPQLAIPDSFKECFTYEQQILYLVKWIGELADAIGGPGSPAIEELQEAIKRITEELARIEAELDGYVKQSDFDSYKDMTDAEIDALKGQIAGLIGSLDSYALKTDLDALETKLNGVIANLGKTYATKSELKTAVDLLQEQIDALKSALDKIPRNPNTNYGVQSMVFPGLNTSGPMHILLQAMYEANNDGLDNKIYSMMYGGPYSANVDSGGSGAGVSLAKRDPIDYVYGRIQRGTDTKVIDRSDKRAAKNYLSAVDEVESENGRLTPGYTAKFKEYLNDSFQQNYPLESGTDINVNYDNLFSQLGVTYDFLVNYLIYALTCHGMGGTRNLDHKVLVDSTPTEGSMRLVESGGVKEYVDSKVAGGGGDITIDPVPTDGSANAVSSNGVFDALKTKQDKLTFDNTPTTGSRNPVTSDGIKNYVDEHAGGGGDITIDSKPTSGSTNAVSSGGTYDAINTVKGIAESALTVGTEAKNESEDNATAIAGLRTDVLAASTAATEAKTIASTANETAQAASTEAAEAKTAADGASTLATSAKTAADTAAAKAEEAMTAAGAAQSSATEAMTNAESALSGLSGKQDTLTFDETPTEGSDNPVTSKGIKAYVDANAGVAAPAITHKLGTGNRVYTLDETGKLISTQLNYDYFMIPVSEASDGSVKYIMSYQNKMVEIVTSKWGTVGVAQNYFVKAFGGADDNTFYMLVCKFHKQNIFDFGVYKGVIGDDGTVTLTGGDNSSTNNEVMVNEFCVSGNSKEIPIVVSNQAVYIYSGSQAGLRKGFTYKKLEGTLHAASNGTTMLVHRNNKLELYGFKAVPVTETMGSTTNHYDAITMELIDSMDTTASIEWMGHDGKQWIIIIGGTIYKIDDYITSLGASMDALYTMTGSMATGGNIQKPTAFAGDGFVSVKIGEVWHTYTGTTDYSDSENVRYTQQGNNIIAMTDTQAGIVPAIGKEPIAWYDMVSTDPVPTNSSSIFDGPGEM